MTDFITIETCAAEFLPLWKASGSIYTRIYSRGSSQRGPVTKVSEKLARPNPQSTLKQRGRLAEEGLGWEGWSGGGCRESDAPECGKVPTVMLYTLILFCPLGLDGVFTGP